METTLTGGDIFNRVDGRGWTQEWHETANGSARVRAKELRALGYKVHVQSMGSQVTHVGVIKLTLVDVRWTDPMEAPARVGEVRS